MSGLTDDYFRDLPPRDRRYDSPLGSGLVFSVFPNGTKCWVLVYSAGGYARRRTLGLFPEMGLAAAHSAADQARQILEVEAQLAASGESTSTASRRGPFPPFLGERPMLAAALGIALAGLLGLLVIWLAR
jgi:hypothetical protein